MRRFRTFFFACLIAVLFLQIWLGFPTRLLSHSNEDSIAKVAEPLSSGRADKVLVGVHFVESQKGERDWEVFADSAEEDRLTKAWTLQSVRALFYSAKGLEYEVKGQQGWMDGKTRHLRIAGKVEIRTTNGYLLRTEEVQYQGLERKLVGPSPTQVISLRRSPESQLSMQGRRLVAWVDKSSVELLDGVKAQRGLTGTRVAVISSQRAEMSSRERRLVFQGEVRITLDQLQAESPEARFESLEGLDLIRSIQLIGGVRLSSADRLATANTIDFDPKENRYVLSGEPRVVQGSDQVRGDRIVLIDGGRRIRVEKLSGEGEQP